MHTTNYTVTLPVYSVVRHHFQTFETEGATELTIHCMDKHLTGPIPYRTSAAVIVGYTQFI